MPSAKREKALKWVDDNIPEGQEIKSNDPSSRFTELTGLTHGGIMDNWQAWADRGHKGPFLTCCNGFVIQYCVFMGLPIDLVQFDAQDIRNYLGSEKVKKSYAWVDPTTQICPSAGDIMIWRGQHVGIALYADLVGDDAGVRLTSLSTVEGGQNHLVWVQKQDPVDNKLKDTNEVDRNKSYDRIKRKRYPDPRNDPPNKSYSGDKLQGWADIDLFFYGPLGEQETDEGRVISSLWFNHDGKVVHPDAPDGGGGPGYFCNAGPLYGDAFGKGLPHPFSPAAQNLDPSAILRFRKDRNEG